MSLKNVLDLLAKNRNDRGVEVWKEMKVPGMESFGIGLTQLKALAKKIRRNHELAQELWQTKIYDARVMGILIEEPDKVTRGQVERQVNECTLWMMSHIYCSTLLGRLSFSADLAADWANEKDDIRRRCAFLVVYHLAQYNKKLHNTFFEDYLDLIKKNIRCEENFVKDAMNSALMAIGKRNIELNATAIAVAKKIGKIVVDYGDNSCQAPNVLPILSDVKLQLRLQSRT